ncbi:hypothetical protein ACI7RC_10335 [Brevibacillus sp. B_LB10_24]|uniref:hypothetical protein n=1 Tax=Brevibacillus sp. B_LB10_24 TaxID=3380645 RepID=UPI0038BDF8F0
MSFQPQVGEEITIGGLAYTFGEHPMAPHVPYGQEGRQGVVYQLIPKIETSSGWKALKVFRSNFRDPQMVYLSERLGQYAKLPGLLVCEREVITPQQNGPLLSHYHDLMYAVVMPWIEGPTWMDVVLDQRDLGRRECLLLARSLAKVLSAMEQRGLAHCDLSGPNIILPRLVKSSIEDGFSYVELVDVEQMHAPNLERPDAVAGGSPGYASPRMSHSAGQWSHYSDRFAGAILLAEMLGWCDQNVRDSAWGESYFMPEEVQQPCKRFDILVESIWRHWGREIAGLLASVWEGQALNQCPTFGEWLLMLMNADETREAVHSNPRQDPVKEAAVSPPVDFGRGELAAGEVDPESLQLYNRQIEQARQLENKGNLEAALDVYRSVQAKLPANNSLAQDLVMITNELEARIEARNLLEQEEWYSEPTETRRDRGGFFKRKVLIAAVSAVLVLGGGGLVWSQIAASKQEQARQAQLAAQQEAEDAARRKALEEEQARMLAQQAAQRQVEEEQRQAELAARQQAEEEQAKRAAAELEAKQKAEQEARKKAQQPAKRAAQKQTSQQQAQLAAKQKAEQEAKKQAELAAKQKAEQEAKKQAELAAKQKAEQEAKKKAEEGKKNKDWYEPNWRDQGDK